AAPRGAPPPSEPEGGARFLAEARAAAGVPGEAPADDPGAGQNRVLVRHPAVARTLASMLPPGTGVDAAWELPALDALADAALAGLGLALTPPRSDPETWAAWDLPAEAVADLFAAAADFYSAAVWADVEPQQRLAVAAAGGEEWSAAILGFDRAVFGLQMEGGEPGAGPSIALYYTAPELLPAAMAPEIRAAGWQVATDNAWPHLIARATPGGGIDRATARLLEGVLRATPGFVARHGAAFRGAPGAALPAEEVDGATGVSLTYTGYDWPAPRGPWEAAPTLAPGGAEGPGAKGAAGAGSPVAAARSITDLLADFASYLAARGEGPTEVGWHTADAEFFLAFLHDHRRTPLAHIHEADLRILIYDWLPRHGRDLGDEAFATVRSLRRFFAFLAAEGRLECPWADGLLADRAAFEERYRSYPGPDSGPAQATWEAELEDDLTRRVMIPLGSDTGPGAERRWLAAREDLVAEGMVEASLVRAALVRRFRRQGQNRA
ncbi:MAG: hypothetical protein ACE5EL_06865, partial [Anaerolineae bacterium]